MRQISRERVPEELFAQLKKSRYLVAVERVGNTFHLVRYANIHGSIAREELENAHADLLDA